MRKFLTSLLVGISLSSFCQNDSTKSSCRETLEVPYKYLASRDSILRETEFGSIYISYDTTVSLYSWLSDESFDTLIFNELFSRENISELYNSNNFKVKHHKNSIIQGSWSSLYVFENKFYVYSPSDWMYNKRMLITDSALYCFGSDDWRIEFIENLETNSSGDIIMQLRGFGEKMELSIRSLDENFSYWNYRTSEGVEFSELRVRSEAVRKVAMIINDCLGRKCFQEFIFKTPEFNEVMEIYNNRNLSLGK